MWTQRKSDVCTAEMCSFFCHIVQRLVTFYHPLPHTEAVELDSSRKPRFCSRWSPNTPSSSLCRRMAGWCFCSMLPSSFHRCTVLWVIDTGKCFWHQDGFISTWCRWTFIYLALYWLIKQGQGTFWALNACYVTLKPNFFIAATIKFKCKGEKCPPSVTFTTGVFIYNPQVRAG